MKQFDSELSSKIKDTFQNHIEPYNQSDWNLLEKKMEFIRRKKIVAFFSISKIASVILLLLTTAGVSFMVGYEFNSVDYIVKKSNSSIIQRSKIIDNELFDKNNQSSILKTNILKSKNNFKLISRNNFYQEKNIEYVDFITKLNFKNKILSGINKLQNNNDTIKISVPSSKKNNIDSVILNRNLILNTELSNKPKKSVKIGAMLSTINNISNNNFEKQNGYGIGANSEIKIFKNISLTTGVILAQQNIHLNSSPELNSKFRNSTITSDTKLDVLALDIPLNIQFNFINLKKSTGFFTLGVSSYTYLSVNQVEEINSSVLVYTNPKTQESSIETTTQTFQTNEKAFNTFDFAKVINFSVGIKYLFRKSEIVLEPYVKYPYNPIYFNKIQFLFGGLSLKYNF